MPNRHGFIVGSTPVIRPGGASVVMTVTGTSANAALPTLDSGKLPPYIAYSGTPLVRLALGLVGVSADDGALLVSGPEFFRVSPGHTHFAMVTTDAGTKFDLSITPLDKVDMRATVPGVKVGGADSVSSTSVANGATVELAIPNASNGKKAKIVHVRGAPATYVKPGFTGDTIHSPIRGTRMRQQHPVIMDVSGYTHILATARTGSGHAVYISPVEE